MPYISRNKVQNLVRIRYLCCLNSWSVASCPKISVRFHLYYGETDKNISGNLCVALKCLIYIGWTPLEMFLGYSILAWKTTVMLRSIKKTKMDLLLFILHQSHKIITLTVDDYFDWMMFEGDVVSKLCACSFTILAIECSKFGYLTAKVYKHFSVYHISIVSLAVLMLKPSVWKYSLAV